MTSTSVATTTPAVNERAIMDGMVLVAGVGILRVNTKRGNMLWEVLWVLLERRDPNGTGVRSLLLKLFSLAKGVFKRLKVLLRLFSCRSGGFDETGRIEMPLKNKEVIPPTKTRFAVSDSLKTFVSRNIAEQMKEQP